MREYVIDSLRGRTACLVIDEMSKGETSFYNLLLCTVGMNAASIVSLQTLKRIPYAVHALNNIMKEPVIGELWNHVVFMSLLSPVGSQSKNNSN